MEDSPGIIVIRAFQCKLAELRSQFTCFRGLFVLCRQNHHHGRHGRRIHRWEGNSNYYHFQNTSLAAKVLQWKYCTWITQGDRQESWEEWEDGVLAQMARLRRRGEERIFTFGISGYCRMSCSRVNIQSDICSFQAVNIETIFFPPRIILGSQGTTWTVLIWLMSLKGWGRRRSVERKPKRWIIAEAEKIYPSIVKIWFF